MIALRVAYEGKLIELSQRAMECDASEGTSFFRLLFATIDATVRVFLSDRIHGFVRYAGTLLSWYWSGS
jgi:hypothetical protein